MRWFVHHVEYLIAGLERMWFREVRIFPREIGAETETHSASCVELVAGGES
jgi:hypothetical protein